MRQLLLAFCVIAVAAPVGAQPLRVLARDIEPFLYRQGGEVTGIDYDILSFFATKEKRELQLVWVEEFDDLLRRLAAGDGDLVASGITLTAARQLRFDDSGPYLPVRVTLVEPTSRTTTALSQLRGATVATMAGSTYEAIVSQVPEANLLYGRDEDELMAMVADGRAVATAVDTIPALYRLSKYPGLHMTLAVSEPQSYGYYVPKGSPLACELAGHLKQLRDSGTYYRVLQKYLGKDAPDMFKAAVD
jgi:ABC-type amino acid transport substrate-binding protein